MWLVKKTIQKILEEILSKRDIKITQRKYLQFQMNQRKFNLQLKSKYEKMQKFRGTVELNICVLIKNLFKQRNFLIIMMKTVKILKRVDQRIY